MARSPKAWAPRSRRVAVGSVLLALLAPAAWAAPAAADVQLGNVSDPFGVAADSAGNVFVAEYHENRVVVERPDGSGSYIQSVVASGLSRPAGVALDGSGDVFIADAGHNRVVKETPSFGGGYTQSVVSDVNLSNPLAVAVDSAGDVWVTDTNVSAIVEEKPNGFGGYTQVTIDESESTPTGIAVDAAGDVFIAAQDFGDNRVVEDKPNGLGSYTQSVVDSSVNSPYGVAVDGSGDVFIADYGNNRVVEDTPDGSGGFTQSVLDNSLGSPDGVAVGDGNVYVADYGNNRVVKDTPDGSGGYTQSILSTLNFPSAVALDGSGDVFIADANHSQVVEDTPNGSGGYAQTTVDSNVSHPYGVAVDGSGDVFIPYGTQVVEDTPDGSGGYTESRTLGSGLAFPEGVAVDGSGDVFIADTNHNRVVKETPNGLGGYSQSTVDSSVFFPAGVAVDAAGDVFIAAGHSVVKDTPNGSGGYTETAAVDSSLQNASGVALDAGGDVFITDSALNEVVEDTPGGGTYTQTVIASGLNAPQGVAVDGSGTVFIDDSGNNRVLEHRLPAPETTSGPWISGSAADGQVLVPEHGGWSDSSLIRFSYQWQRCDSSETSCTNVGGMHSYRLTSTDIGQAFRLVVTATDPFGQQTVAAASTAAPVGDPPAPVKTMAPSISGATTDGAELKALRGTWSSPDRLTIDYQWERCDSSGQHCAGVGSSGPSQYYRQSAADVRHTIAVVVTATDQEGQTGEATVSAVGPVGDPPAPSNTGAPSISGATTDGIYLKALAGSWSSPDRLTDSYQWERCDRSGDGCAPIGSPTASRYYRQSAADVGHTIAVVVTATDQEGQTGEATVSAVGSVGDPAAPLNTGAPSISGPPTNGMYLKVLASWSSPDRLSYGYQWERCDGSGDGCTPIGLPTASRYYRQSAADVGHTIAVVVTATDQEGQHTSATAGAVGPVG